ncbi:unnamed protein product [Miscanthus lutarioriparius]|uniref:Uncharacterized protein n=1 Tax=Miscanthus lutarioriparius TaxID=422564 RepID=A0A811MYP9_9POAL|nr:unnamed protein product [Miscanthus lutarioriparius]
MEQVKEAVAHQLCRSALRDEMAVSQILEVIRPVLPLARSCYDDTVETIESSDLAYMMVVDGCFLLAVMSILTRNYPERLEHSSLTHGRMLRIMKDILLFENQIPWAVMRRLFDMWPVPVVDQFVSMVLAYFDFDRHLGLKGPDAPEGNGGGAVRYCDYARPFAHFTSAVELAEAGIHLHGSGTCRVKDVRVAQEPRSLLRIGQLVLPKLALSWLPRCWLINMVALECVTDRSDRSGVSSYLAILGSLVRAERDVEELRSRRILFSTMSDQRTVEFFEGSLPR